MEKLRAILREYSDELLFKVQWPSLDELQGSTVTVLIASLMLAVVIALMDFLFNTAMSGVYSLVGG
ncbi:MAG: preprotein translocase subunit SecE [Bacteroidia bacterium]|nr:preprotein translocase subunit SecE [Bacteroidia bacterium]